MLSSKNTTPMPIDSIAVEAKDIPLSNIVDPILSGIRNIRKKIKITIIDTN